MLHLREARMGGFLVFIVIVVGIAVMASMLSKVKSLEAEILLIRQQMAIMQRTLGNLIRGAGTEAEVRQAPQVAGPPAEAVYTTEPPPRPAAMPSLRGAGAAATVQTPYPGHAPAAPTRPSRTQQELEALIGEKLLNRVGAVALIIGVGFFLKYAFDRNWISPTIRVLMGLILGIALVVLASRQRERLPIFAQGILGAGLSILYLSSYATFGFYQLVPKTVAFAMMSAVTVLTLERGRRFDSLAVALLGWAGGSLTPALLSGGEQTSVTGFFIYLSLLNVAVLGLAAMRRRWWVLEPLSLVATYLNYTGWYQGATERPLATTASFLILVWAMFHVLDWYQEARHREEDELQRGLTAALNALLFFGAMGVLLAASESDAMRWVSLGLALGYAAPGVLLKRSIPRHSLKSLVFLMTATGMAFEDFTTVELWAAEALAVLALSLAIKTPHLHLYALGAFAFTIASLFVTPDALDRFPGFSDEAFILNPRGFAYLAVAGACALGTLTYRLLKDRELIQESEYGKPLLHHAWGVVLFVLMTVEILDHFERTAGTAARSDARTWETALILSSAWIGYGLLLLFGGKRARVGAVTHVGVAAMALSLLTTALFAVTFLPIAEFALIANLRFAVVALSMAAAYAATLLLRDEGWERNVSIGLNIVIALLSFELLTAETRDHFQRQIALSGDGGSGPSPDGGVVLGIRNKQQLAISAAWLIYSAVTMTIGIARRIRGFRIAAIALLSLTILKVFLYDLSFLTELYRIFSFIGLGVILLAASFAYQRYKTLIFGEG